MQEAIQKFSRALIVPVKYLAVMGLGLALAVILQLEFMPQFLQSVGLFINIMMNGMLNNLALIFCVGIAASFADRQKIEAGITALIVFLMFLATNNAWLDMTGTLAEPGEMGLFSTGQAMVLGFQIIDMNVLLGIMLGVLVGVVHNKTANIKVPDYLNIYGGARLSFIILIPITLVLAIVLSYIWPFINNAIGSASNFILTTGLLGLFLYSFGNRFLVPTGLHHLLWMPFCFTAIGGTAEIGGEIYSGAVNIFLAQMANAGAVTELDPTLRFATFGFAKIFASIPIVLAFIKTAYPENKDETKARLFPSATVAVLSGVTEPLDFSFAFSAPLLWLVHSLLTAIGETLLWALGSRTYMLYGAIDTVISNSVFSPNVTKFYLVIIVGIIMMAIWYYTFVFLIKKFNMMTPGREPVTAIGPDVSVKNMDPDQDIERLIRGLGGVDNIQSLTNCYTRLRADVIDEQLVDKSELEKVSKQQGIFTNGKNVQVVVGMGVQDFREEISSKYHLD